MAFWLRGFLFGAFLGLLTPSLKLIWMMTVACSFVVASLVLLSHAPIKRMQSFIFLGAAFWGFWNNPAPLRNHSAPVRVESAFPGLPFVIVSDQMGRRALLHGEGKKEWGRAVCYRPLTWFFDACHYRGTSGDIERRSTLWRGLDWVKARILESAQAFPYGWRAWFGATVLGSKPPASTPWLKNFRLTGLLHLVVVSGFHVTFVAGLIGGLFRVPLMILYAFRIVSPGLWVRLSCLSNLQSLAAVAVYCYVVGLAPPCQRALVSYALSILSPLVIGETSLRQRLLLTASLQSFIFPTGYVSISNLLSWGATILVLDVARRPLKWKSKVLEYASLQIKIICLCGALLNQAAMASVISNLILGPIFLPVFITAILALFLNSFSSNGGALDFMMFVQESYLRLVGVFADWGERAFGKAILLPLSGGFHFAVCILSLWYVVSAWRRVMGGGSNHAALSRVLG